MTTIKAPAGAPASSSFDAGQCCLPVARRAQGSQPRPVPLLALTVRQPWASAIVFGGKDIENRGWEASYRGRLWIHAGLGEDAAPDEAWTADEEHGSPRGVILGHVRLIDCTRLRTGSPWAVPGAWHWLIGDAVALGRAVPCKGQRGLWTVPDEAESAVLAQLANSTEEK